MGIKVNQMMKQGKKGLAILRTGRRTVALIKETPFFRNRRMEKAARKNRARVEKQHFFTSLPTFWVRFKIVGRIALVLKHRYF